VTGSELVTQVQSLEFSDLESTSWGGANPDAVYVTDNLMFEPDRKRHRFLRNLVGSTMTPAALATAVPSLQRLAKDYIHQLLTQGKDASPVCMDTICQGYTMDIVQTQKFLDWTANNKTTNSKTSSGFGCGECIRCGSILEFWSGIQKPTRQNNI